MSGFTLHALHSAARATEGFSVGRPKARADPQHAVALPTRAGGGHVPVQYWYSRFVGKRPSKGRSLIQLSEGTVWSIWKLMWKSFIFSAPSWSVFTASAPLFNLPAPPHIQAKDALKQTRTNYLHDIIEKHVWLYGFPPLVLDYAWLLLHLPSQKRLNTKYGSHIALQGKRPW